MVDSLLLLNHDVQAEREYRQIQEILTSVESDYIDGRPLYHQPEARERGLSPNTSQFFMTTYNDWCDMGPRVAQEIFRDRHIVVTGVQVPKRQFDLDSLERLGNLDQPREMQGRFYPLFTWMCLVELMSDLWLRNPDNPNDCLRVGTLRQFFEEGTQNGRLLNILDISLGGESSAKAPEGYE